jgi:hypothetical protein
VLLNHINPKTLRGVRLSDELALATIEVDGKEGLYKLTPTKSQLLQPRSEQAVDAGAFLVVDYRDPYVLLISVQLQPAQPVLLVNLDAGTYEPLGAPTLGTSRNYCCRISEDGSKVRYIGAYLPDNSDSWALRERTVATGDERIVARLGASLAIQPDQYGDRWLYQTRDQATKAIAYSWITIDGATQPVSSEPPDSAHSQRLFQNNLFIVPFNCQADCRVELQPLNGGTSATFTFSNDQPNAIPLPLRELEDGGLAVLVNEQFVALNADGTATAIGYWSPQNIAQGVSESVSPNGRWVLALDAKSPTRYRVWDNRDKKYVVDVPIANFAFLTIQYSGSAFLLDDLASSPPKAILRSEGGQMIDLPPSKSGVYFDLTADQGVLFVEQRGAERKPGIYRYDPANNTSTLLVENGVPVSLVDAAQSLKLR